MESRGVRYLGLAEDVVLALVAIVLVVLAVALLANSVVDMVNGIAAGQVADLGIQILNGIILVMMIMEIVHTVTVSIAEHVVTAEPFLIIGAIAAIRRMLVITAQGTELELTNPDAFRSLLLELALLAFIVFVMVISVFILRHSRINGEPDEQAEARDQPTL
jgi:phosphate starvation-inducible membrane PsiE